MDCQRADIHGMNVESLEELTLANIKDANGAFLSARYQPLSLRTIGNGRGAIGMRSGLRKSHNLGFVRWKGPVPQSHTVRLVDVGDER